MVGVGRRPIDVTGRDTPTLFITQLDNHDPPVNNQPLVAGALNKVRGHAPSMLREGHIGLVKNSTIMVHQ